MSVESLQLTSSSVAPAGRRVDGRTNRNPPSKGRSASHRDIRATEPHHDCLYNPPRYILGNRCGEGGALDIFQTAIGARRIGAASFIQRLLSAVKSHHFWPSSAPAARPLHSQAPLLGRAMQLYEQLSCARQIPQADAAALNHLDTPPPSLLASAHATTRADPLFTSSLSTNSRSDRSAPSRPEIPQS